MGDYGSLCWSDYHNNSTNTTGHFEGTERWPEHARRRCCSSRGTEDIRDVEDATVESVDENTAYGIPGLGHYLPTDLPAGYHFGKASLYETTMKSGTKYHLLRVTFTTSSDEIIMAPANEDGGIAVPDPNLFGSSFAVLIMDYEPRTNKPVYSFENLQEYLETKDDNVTFHFAYKDIFIGFSPDDLSAEEILDVVNSIP